MEYKEELKRIDDRNGKLRKKMSKYRARIEERKSDEFVLKQMQQELYRNKQKKRKIKEWIEHIDE